MDSNRQMEKSAAGRNDQPLRRRSTPPLGVETAAQATRGYCDSPIVTYLVSVSNVSGSSFVPGVVVLLTVI